MDQISGGAAQASARSLSCLGDSNVQPGLGNTHLNSGSFQTMECLRDHPDLTKRIVSAGVVGPESAGHNAGNGQDRQRATEQGDGTLDKAGLGTGCRDHFRGLSLTKASPHRM